MQENIPALRFPEFDGRWEEKKLGDICQNISNRRIPIKESDRIRGNIPYYGASGIVDYVNDYIFNEDILLVSEDGANLIMRSTPIAFSVVGKVWVNNHAHVLKFNTFATQIIVEQYINSINIKKYITGQAQPKLNKASLEKITIPLPTFPEQQKIADFLSSVDEKLHA